MDKQQEQMKQNPNQEVEYTSGFLNEDEEVNESEFDESVGEQEADKWVDNQQNKPDREEQPKKREQRPRKTIEQEIAELDAKRERLMEKKRRQEAHEKIVFGAIVIGMLHDMKNKSDKDYSIFCKKIIEYTKLEQQKYEEIVNKIIIN